MTVINKTAKKFIRSAYTPLELEHFSETTQKEFCREIIKKDDISQVNKLLTKQAFRAALHSMIDYRRQDEHRSEEHQMLIRKDFEIIDSCYDAPIETFYDEHNSQRIEFFEDYTVLVSDQVWQYPPFFYENYYSYIYNNIKHLYYVIHYEEKVTENKLEKFGVSFEKDGDNLTVLYTKKFKDGLFTPSYFKQKD